MHAVKHNVKQSMLLDIVRSAAFAITLLQTQLHQTSLTTGVDLFIFVHKVVYALLVLKLNTTVILHATQKTARAHLNVRVLCVSVAQVYY
jgi:hypothetical protein